MSANEKIRSTHLERKAMVYARQSTLKQLQEHRESTARQYALKERALNLGFPEHRVEVIDDDLGQSGSSSDWRVGFQRLAEEVAHGRVGAIFALEVSRLSRSSADWHRLLELCALTDVVIIDEQAVYCPNDYNDRLLLGLKGQMSEAEQYWMRLRLHGGMLAKARRGELFFFPAAGYVWDAASARFRFDPDERVQRAVRLVFERFRLDGSAYAVGRYIAQSGLELPSVALMSRELRWIKPRVSHIYCMLKNPIYAGAYVFGRNESRLGLVDGKLRRRKTTKLQPAAWKVCIKDRHPGYITWEEFTANQQKLSENRTSMSSTPVRGAAREGRGLLQGLVLCGRCGRRMNTRYPGDGQRSVYQCRPNIIAASSVCFSIAGQRIDGAVEKLFLDAMQPPELELSLAVAREAQAQGSELERQWKLRVERLRYDVKMAERRYKAVDAENRVVARTLEREWEEKLREVQQAEAEHEHLRQQEKVELSEEDRRRVLSLARNLKQVWRAKSTTHAERKNLLRMLIREVTLKPVDVPKTLRVQVLWQTGAVSELTLPRRDKYDGQVTPPEVTHAVRELFAKKMNDAKIATELSRRGLLRVSGGDWDVAAVQRIRYAQGLHARSRKGHPAPTQRGDGLYSTYGVAQRFGVTMSAVRCWIESGLLEKHDGGGGPGRPLWFKLDDDVVQRLKNALGQRSSPAVCK
jgi:DNA invertase Pin-like site-specific DNA recombinase